MTHPSNEPRAGYPTAPGRTDQHSGDPEVLRAQVAEARQRLGDTIEELAAKADVRARARRKTAAMRRRVSGPRARTEAAGGSGPQGAATTGPTPRATAHPLPEAGARRKPGARHHARHGTGSEAGHGRSRWARAGMVAAGIGAAGVAWVVAVDHHERARRAAMPAWRRACERWSTR
jgi:Protein of unknown function (DUF3618)